jgi:hypothetical protein
MPTTNPTLKEIVKGIEEIFNQIPKTCTTCKRRYKGYCKPCKRKLKIKSILKPD